MALAITVALVGCGSRSHDHPGAGVEPDAPPAPPAIDASLPDASIPAGSRIVVSPDGDDANDPLVAPVRTVRRAIDLAARHAEYTTIALREGRYSAATGETFPYAVPSGVTIAGPLDREAALIGDGVVDGLTLADGALVSIALESFGTALTARASSTWTDVVIRDSHVGGLLDQDASVTARHLQISAAPEKCRVGLDLRDRAALDATGLAIATGGEAVFAHDQSTVAIRSSGVGGDQGCMRATLASTSAGQLSVTSSEIGGGAAGIGVSGGGELSVSNVQIHDCGIGIAGNAAAANLDRVTVTRATGDGLRIFGGHWTVSSLFCDSSEDTALYVANPADVPTSITVRNSTLRGSSFGISVSHPAQLDLGTAADPGGNIIQGTFKSMYLSFPGDVIEPIVLQAVGNTWQPYRQGADPEGHYTTRVVKSPLVTDLRGDNFWLFGLGWQIQL